MNQNKSQGNIEEIMKQLKQQQQHIEELEYANMMFRQAYFCSRFLLRFEFSPMFQDKMVSQMEQQHIQDMIDEEIDEPENDFKMDRQTVTNKNKQTKKKCDLSYV